MTTYSGLDRPKNKLYYQIWGALFFLSLAALLAALFFATQSVEYTWRWNRVPQYFFYQDKIEIRAEMEGSIVSITPQNESALLTIRGTDGEEQHAVPRNALLLTVNDYVYPGDVLGSYSRWKPGILLEGLWLTLEVSAIAIIFGIILGLFTGLARISDNPAFRWGAIVYIELIRGSPLLVQIFLWYFVVGTVINTMLATHGLGQIPALWFGVLALAIFTGAYTAEIVRAGIQSVHRGQMEAARSLGLTYTQAMRKIILPQAFRRILPPLAGQFISLVKDSSLLGVISIRELTKATREVVTASLQPFEIWIVCALLYLILTFTLSMFVQYLERKAI
ncbi:amino acid ABC transporter permease [Desulfovibrionales bacterium]